MKKIFIHGGPPKKVGKEYISEISKAYNIFLNDKNSKSESIKKLNYKTLNNFEIIIYNDLPNKVEKILNKKKKILININKFDLRSKYTDLFIDKNYDNEKIGNRVLSEKISHNKKNDINFKKILSILNIMNWDTKFWGLKVASLDSFILTENIIYQMNKFIKKEKIKLVQYLSDIHNPETVKLAEKNNFSLKDVRYLFNLNLNNFKEEKKKLKNTLTLKKAKNKDFHLIIKKLGNSYSDSRYYFDGNFPKKKVKKFYDDWIKKAIKGLFDDECILGVYKSKIVGFCTLRYENKFRRANIGLFSIIPEYRNQNFGKILLIKILSNLKKENFKYVNVVTQSRNFKAQRLYQNCGFKTLSNKIWYHKWV